MISAYGRGVVLGVVVSFSGPSHGNDNECTELDQQRAATRFHVVQRTYTSFRDAVATSSHRAGNDDEFVDLLVLPRYLMSRHFCGPKQDFGKGLSLSEELVSDPNIHGAEKIALEIDLVMAYAAVAFADLGPPDWEIALQLVGWLRLGDVPRDMWVKSEEEREQWMRKAADVLRPRVERMKAGEFDPDFAWVVKDILIRFGGDPLGKPLARLSAQEREWKLERAKHVKASGALAVGAYPITYKGMGLGDVYNLGFSTPQDALVEYFYFADERRFGQGDEEAYREARDKAVAKLAMKARRYCVRIARKEPWMGLLYLSEKNNGKLLALLEACAVDTARVGCHQISALAAGHAYDKGCFGVEKSWSKHRFYKQFWPRYRDLNTPYNFMGEIPLIRDMRVDPFPTR